LTNVILLDIAYNAGIHYETFMLLSCSFPD